MLAKKNCCGDYQCGKMLSIHIQYTLCSVETLILEMVTAV